MYGSMHDTIHQKQTAAFIGQNPVEVEFLRSARVSDGKGGWKNGPPSTLPSQCVRKVGSTRVSGTSTFTNTDGRIVVPTAALIGLPDVDMERGDKFTLEDQVWEILKVDTDPPWRKQALVVEHS